MSAYKLNNDLMTKLQDDNQQLVDMLGKFGTSVQFIEERRDLIDLIVVEKCLTIEDRNEQSAILASPDHRDFYLLLQRKLKCMIKACETLSTGTVEFGAGNMRAFTARTIRDKGCNVFRETKLGFLVASAVEWSKHNLAAVPFIDTIGSVFQLIVALKDEHDRYLGLAHVADFATMVCLPYYGTTSLDNAIEQFARLIVRARCGSPSCQFVEDNDEFGKLKQLMIKLLADSGNTPAKEQASIAADCAFAHIMKPRQDSILFGVLNNSIVDADLVEALAATTLGISVEDLKQLEQISLSSQTISLTNNDMPTNEITANVSNEVLHGMSASVSAGTRSTIDHSASYASSDAVAEQEARIQKQDEVIRQLSRKIARLERNIDDDSGGGTMYARPEDVFRNEIANVRNLKNNVRGLTDEVTTIDYQVTNHNLRILILEERLQERESTGVSENGRTKNKKK